MKVTPLAIPGLLLIELEVRGDARGFFIERYQQEKFVGLGLPKNFVQDNHSRSAPGVLRGLHYQYDPPQGKLVGVVRGRIWDVAVDIRKGSATFGKHLGIELSDTNGRMLWMPAGFAHGFCVIGEEPADVVYKVDNLYGPTGEGGISWNDAELKVEWPCTEPTISARDQKQQSFAHYTAKPAFE